MSSLLDQTGLARILGKNRRAYESLRRTRQRVRVRRGIVHDSVFLIFHLLDEEGLCVDVGANTGQSLASIKAVRPEWAIYSMEPNPMVADELIQTACRYSQVTVDLRAASDGEGRLPLSTPIGGRTPSTQASTLDSAFWDRRADEVQRRWGGYSGAIIRTVDSVCGDSLELSPQVLKIDVEGLEAQVIRGFESTIKRCHPLVLFESLHGDGAAEELLGTWGYRLYEFCAEPMALKPLGRGQGHALNTIGIHPGSVAGGLRALVMSAEGRS